MCFDLRRALACSWYLRLCLCVCVCVCPVRRWQGVVAAAQQAGDTQSVRELKRMGGAGSNMRKRCVCSCTTGLRLGTACKDTHVCTLARCCTVLRTWCIAPGACNVSPVTAEVACSRHQRCEGKDIWMYVHVCAHCKQEGKAAQAAPALPQRHKHTPKETAQNRRQRTGHFVKQWP